MEVTLLDYRFIRAKPSFIAAVGMYIARRMLDGDWVRYQLLSFGVQLIFTDTAIAVSFFAERRLCLLL